MNIKIGTIIKELRVSKKITQEQLASFLGVTPQAISRWEAQVGYPDIENLPLLADFFGVSVDDLIGYKLSEREKALEEIKKEANRLSELNEFDRLVDFMRASLAAYPFDLDLKLYLASGLYVMWYETRETALYNEAVALCEFVLESTEDIDRKDTAINCLCSFYGETGEPEKAYQVINRHLTPMKYCKEFTLSMGFDKEKNEYYKQDEIGKLTDCLGTSIRNLAIDDDLPNDPSTWDKKIEMLKISNSIYEMIYGENLMFYHTRLARNHHLISTYQIAQGKTEEAIGSLEKMLFHTLAYDRSHREDHGKYYSSILTDKLTYPYPDKDFHELTEHNDAYRNAERMRHSRYDAIRNDTRFIAIVKSLGENAE